MTNQEAAEMIRNDMKLHHDYLSGEYRKALKMAISALQEQEVKTQLSREDTTHKVKKTCITCKHYPPESKWPCIDCDMRNPADRWEPQEVKNSTQEAVNLTQKGLDTISRTAAISELMEWVEKEEKKSWSTFKGLFHWTGIKAMLECLPSAEPDRKTGWWMIREGMSDVQCSECGMYFSDVYDMENSDAFCRHCGTKMEGLKVVKNG